MDAIIFRCGKYRGAIQIKDVRELITLNQITDVPAAPPIISGAISVHGQILPLINLSHWLGSRTRMAAGDNTGIVVQAAGMLAVLGGASGMQVGTLVGDHEGQEGATSSKYHDEEGDVILLELGDLLRDLVSEVEKYGERLSSPHSIIGESSKVEVKE